MSKLSTLIIITIVTISVSAQQRNNWSGNLSAWGNHNDALKTLQIGLRLIPQYNQILYKKPNSQWDLEGSANLFTSGEANFGETNNWETAIKPYRLWARYSTNQWEIRGGLQKINFGSAMMLRPLMWFDKVDPRDPLQMTDGVYGFLSRYYFLNNANIWLWGLMGNNNTKTWENGKTTPGKPEFGARFQHPLLRGDAAISTHYRLVDEYATNSTPQWQVPEWRWGFDIKMDWTIGLWVESAWIHKGAQTIFYREQLLTTLGADYTFGIGSGLNITTEHLVATTGNNPGTLQQPIQITGISANYPIGISGQLSAMLYADWENKSTYNFCNYKHTFKNILAHLMLYHNPQRVLLPTQSNSAQQMSGTGIMLMAIYKY